MRSTIAAVVVVVSSTGASLPQTIDKLAKSGECTYRGGSFMNGQKAVAQMSIRNDGGWCWSDGYAMPQTGFYLSASDLKVTTPPKHGEVAIGDMPSHHLRIAYRPAAGFSGEDSYTVHYNITEAEKTITVTVSK
jgi:hypothetical protein